MRKGEPGVMLAGRLRSRGQATLSGADGTRVRVGQPVTVRVADEGAGSVEFHGTVSRVNALDRTSPQERRVEVVLPVLSSTAHWVGQPVSLKIEVANDDPAAAVQTQPVTSGRVEGHLFERGQVERADGLPVRVVAARQPAARAPAPRRLAPPAGAAPAAAWCCPPCSPGASSPIVRSRRPRGPPLTAPGSSPRLCCPS